jgi:hypothetical protein
VDRLLVAMLDAGQIERSDGYYFLAGCAQSSFAEMKQRRKSLSLRIVAEHEKLLKFIKDLPFVKLLAISGSLAIDNAVVTSEKEVDLDLFIITAPGSLHILRFMHRIFRLYEKVLTRVGLKKKISALCPNYLTESSFLEITNKSFFTATDTLQVKVLKGGQQYQKFLSANRWIRSYYPWVDCDFEPGEEDVGTPWVRGILNALCFSLFAIVSTSKSLILGRRRYYSARFQVDRAASFRRLAQVGGGYQPQVAARFREIYGEAFGDDAELNEYLFPGTTEDGISFDGILVRPSMKDLGYDQQILSDCRRVF